MIFNDFLITASLFLLFSCYHVLTTLYLLETFYHLLINLLIFLSLGRYRLAPVLECVACLKDFN